ncbi:hypothetical protein V8E55_000358 [Tylopilus felleus]
MSSIDNEDDPAFLALSARLRRRIDNAFNSVVSSGTRSKSEIPAGGFMVEESEAGPSQYEAGGFIIADIPSSHFGAQSHILLSEIPRALTLLDLSPDDEVMGVFKNATTGWGSQDASNDGVSRKDWRAVCAVLLEGEDDDGNDEENPVADEMSADSGPDSDEYQMEEPLSDDTNEASTDEYEETSSAPRAKKAYKALASRTPTKHSGTETSRQLTELEKAQCRREFSRFFPGIPDDQLDQQRIAIKHIARVADLLKENLKTEEILEMLEAFSTSPDKSMRLTDFEHMMILTKLV